MSERTGSLHVRVGPMCASKTWTNIKEVTIHADVFEDEKIAFINHEFDNRDVKNIISSHSSAFKGISDKITVFKTKQLKNVDVEEYTVVGLDECQFYDDLYETVLQWVREGKHVYCAGLDGDFKMEPFGQIARLLPIADTFEKMHAVCKECLKENPNAPLKSIPAAFTKRIVKNDSQIAIGGTEMYVPVCRRHFF